MKYIRTNDGIIENKLRYWYCNDLHKYLIVPNQSPVRKDKIKKYFSSHQILKQADTIEELCDEFVVISDNCERPIISALPFNELQLYAKGRTKYATCYGAIWCEWGLKYVAKMNSKGDLELL